MTAVPANDLVLRSVAGAVATLTLNRPDKANALSEDMIAALEEQINEAGADSAIRVVILAARGKIFCAGHDLAEMRQQAGRDTFEAIFARCTRMMLSIRDCPKPVIARVQGAAVAAGCQLVATCDLAYAADTARFGLSGINLGLFCSSPSVAVARAVNRKQTLDLLLTGRLVSADRAAAIGLINGAVPAAELDRAVGEAADAIAAQLPEAIALGKDVFYRQAEMDLSEAYGIANARMAENMTFTGTEDLIDAFLAGR